MQKNSNKSEFYINKAESEPSMKNSTNPIDGSGLVAKINFLGKGHLPGKTTFTSNNHHSDKLFGMFDYMAFIKDINEIVSNHKNIKEYQNAFHRLFVNKLNCVYTALGVINESSQSIDIKLLDRNSNVFSYKVFLNDKDNEIVKALDSGNNIFLNNSDYLKMPALGNSPSVIMPISVNGKNIGIALAGDYNIQNYSELYKLAAANLGLLVQNSMFSEQVAKGSYIDSLTGLYSHRRFHELLAQEIEYAAVSGTKVSVAIFDINDMSSINSEFGHSKGDEVIKTVAQKINENLKKNDFAARYGGDKISVVLRNMNAEEAKYMAEYLAYSISCCLIDDIGPVNGVSVGISTYPDDSESKDKLLILTEQAVLVSKTKGYTNGRSPIVSTQDYDFWDDLALNSFAKVMAKRHSQLGINFEEALVQQFQNEDILSQHHLLEVVTSLANAIDAKDEYTKDHSSSVSRYAVALAQAINLPKKEIERIKLGALLHDVGKIGVPESVLTKPTRLTDEEFDIIKQHPTIAVEKILEPNPLLHDLIPIVKYHHEQWNGNGYPCKLKGEEIPLAARIVAIADTYHALISDRPYRKGMSFTKACKILEEGAGIQWDKELVRQFIAIAPSLASKI